MNAPAGCTIEVLDAVACLDLLAWVRGERSATDTDPEAAWLLAHCDDGVTWGKRSGSGWQTGAALFPDISPPITAATLIELRLFGEKEEILIWKSSDGVCGRRLGDTNGFLDEAVRPKDELRVLLGDRLVGAPREGFSRVGSPTGAEQVVPLTLDGPLFDGTRWPLRLQVRHYVQEHPETGAVRIAATRLVDVRLERKGAH